MAIIVSFNVVREFNGNQVTQQYKGSLSDPGEKLTLTVLACGGGRGKRGGKGGGREVVFKRAG